MNTRGYSAYNLARGVLLNSKLTLADSGNRPLKLLDIVVSGMGMDPGAGLWLIPLNAVPAVPRVFPFDIIYLDKEYRVLDTAEMGPGVAFPAFHAEVASALVLPSDTLRRTHTEANDRLIVCVSNELEALLAASSLLAPDTAEPLIDPAGGAAVSTGKPSRPGVIDVAPSTPPVAAPGPATAFEQSILTAVAKVAETGNALEPKPSARQDAVVPGPSIAITEAVLDLPRWVQPAIVEHRIDPEDLFSNWVVSAPPVPLKGRVGPPVAPEAPKSGVAAEETTAQPPRQNGRKSSASKPPAENPLATRTSSADSSPSKVQAKPKPSDKPLLSSKKTGDSVKADKTVKAREPAPPVLPATTFTAVPYGMWQVSMPTAVASMAGAKSPAPANRPESGNVTRVKPDIPESPEKPAASVAMLATETAASPQAPPAKVESTSKTPGLAPSPKPAVRDSASSEAHRPGDFVASLQEKLQRAQQSRSSPTSPADTTPETSMAAAGNTSLAPIPSPASSPQLAAGSDPSITTRPAVQTTRPASDPTKSVSAPAPLFKPTPSSPVKSKEPASGGFRSKFKQWLNPGSSPSDRRRAGRRYVPGMVAHYFTGGAPKPRDVADISMSGMYVLTDDRWMPGTMIQMTLQKPCAQGEKKQSINVLSRIVRRGSDGVAAEFVMPEALSHISHDIQPSQATDKFALARFL